MSIAIAPFPQILLPFYDDYVLDVYWGRSCPVSWDLLFALLLQRASFLSAKRSAVSGTTDRLVRSVSISIEKKSTYRRMDGIRAAAADSYAQSQLDPMEKYAQFSNLFS